MFSKRRVRLPVNDGQQTLKVAEQTRQGHFVLKKFKNYNDFQV